MQKISMRIWEVENPVKKDMLFNNKKLFESIEYNDAVYTIIIVKAAEKDIYC